MPLFRRLKNSCELRFGRRWRSRCGLESCREMTALDHSAMWDQQPPAADPLQLALQHLDPKKQGHAGVRRENREKNDALPKASTQQISIS